ncbi:S41 family peptidase [Gluconobacter wancherniae]|uniref:S41 family peptidase n=1 Tax=Gluconobacter wancherniae TaxID=1307955 RepID=UPI001B8B926C|nr:S41 family peptidase [Gluconobacter wancherniae]MBS1095671.1 hypothetical protein [Gluconobacter wancherniae]
MNLSKYLRAFFISIISLSAFFIVIKNTNQSNPNSSLEEFWKIVNENYYSKYGHKNDFSTIERESFINLNRDDTMINLYENIFPGVVSLFEDSHFAIYPPKNLKNISTSIISVTAIPIPAKELICSGVVISPARLSIRPSLLYIGKNSSFNRTNLNNEWRLDNISKKEEYYTLKFISRNGETHLINIEKNKNVKNDVDTLFGLYNRSEDAHGEYYFSSLDAYFSIGIPYRSPEIAYIIPGSNAANSHVPVGAVWKKYTTMKSKSGEMFGEISFFSGGSHYTFSTKNNLCDKSEIYNNKQYFYIGEDTEYIRFDKFDDKTAFILHDLIINSPKNIIIDLRRNTGGYESSLLRMLGYFIGKNKYVGYVETYLKKEKEFTSANKSFDGKKNVAILISSATSSSAEIFSSEMRSNFDARIFGDRSSGQVLQSKKFTLPDGGVVQLPVGIFYDSRGNKIEGNGINSDQDDRYQESKDQLLISATDWIKSRDNIK